MAAAPHQPEWSSQLWTASSEPQFADSLCSDADGFDQREISSGEDGWGEVNAKNSSGRVFRAQAKAAHLASSRDLCATWSHVARLSATDSMNCQDRAGQLRARVALFERPERLLREAAQPQMPSVKRISGGPYAAIMAPPQPMPMSNVETRSARRLSRPHDLKLFCFFNLMLVTIF
jgi:hypothetical protein